ncbi:hypothetical protein AUC70_11650 [Methyloceanibacter stevinii]|uniref:DUF4376 domain-containing protein n=1 Tax=Methyloceanibacter stevinii TaxID=1774970 RepID=A0A1E3VJ26_9HYPH|nr:hypothetical protein [Methyloceanibacter stevinii]ODR93513.1 hypothetical protein AUC70_11650 [Methyloceanibacter stevinii]
MEIWTYNPKTGELLPGNPREAQVVWTRRHLPDADPSRYGVPANATTMAPPDEVDGHARCFIEGGWVQVEDHQPRDPETGVRLPLTVYLTADRLDEEDNLVAPMGSSITHNELGPLPDDVTKDEPGPYDTWDPEAGEWAEDAEKRAAVLRPKIDAERDRRLNEGFADPVTGKSWACDDKSIAKWNAIGSNAGISIAMGVSPLPTFEGIAMDNAKVGLTAAEAFALFAQRVMPWASEVIIAARDLKDMDPIPDDFDEDWRWPSVPA